MGEPKNSDNPRDGAASGMAEAAPSLGTGAVDAKPARLSEEVADFYERVWASARAGCLGLLRGLGCSEAEAEEVFGDVYTKVMAKVDPVEGDMPEPKMVNFLKVACRRRLIDIRRHEGVLREVAVAEVEPLADRDADEPYEVAEISEAIEVGKEAILSLSPRDRLVYQLRYQLELTPEEVQDRVPWLTANGYRKAIQRSNARVLVAYERIRSGERCEELADGALRRFLSGAAGADLIEEVEAHLKHCRPCQRSCREMREYLHDVGSTLALLATVAGTGEGVFTHAFGVLREAGTSLLSAGQSLHERSRELLLRAFVGGPAREGGVGQLIGMSGIKIGGLCAGVAVVSCAAAGVIPGIGPLDLEGSSEEVSRSVREAPAPLPPSVPQALRAVRLREPARTQTAGRSSAQPRKRPESQGGNGASASRAAARTSAPAPPRLKPVETEESGSPVAPVEAAPTPAAAPPVSGGAAAGDVGAAGGSGSGAAGEFGP